MKLTVEAGSAGKLQLSAVVLAVNLIGWVLIVDNS